MNIPAIGLLLLLLSSSNVLAADFDQLTQNIQEALSQYGYKPGPADGYFGRNTEQAILQFQRDFRLEETGLADQRTASQLGLNDYEDFPEAKILVVDVSSDQVTKMITGHRFPEVVAALDALSRKNTLQIDSLFERPKTVIFVSMAEHKPGDIVFTQTEVIRADNPTFTESFYYEITEETPVQPLIIVNEVEAGWELQITHRFGTDEGILAERRTHAIK